MEDEAVDILSRVGNYSDYINRLILQHAKEWTAALSVLRERGWRSEELLAACDALAGYALEHTNSAGAFIAEELVRLEESRRDFAQRGVPSQRRNRCFAQLAEEPETARALIAIVREFWLYNEDCKQAIRQSAERERRRASP